MTRDGRKARLRFAIHPSLELRTVAHRERHLYQIAAGRLSCISFEIHRNEPMEMPPPLSMFLVS
jgi:hypothetical protein